MTDHLADAFSELREVEAEAELLGQALSALKEEPGRFAGIHEWLAVQGIASAIEKIYSGCERVMVHVARRIDGEAVRKDEAWHRALLDRMANPFGDLRPALLSPSTRNILDDLRSFRHRERNTYGRMLHRESVLGIAQEAVELPAFLRRDPERLDAFLAGKGA